MSVFTTKIGLLVASVATSAALAACGGGKGSGSSTQTQESGASTQTQGSGASTQTQLPFRFFSPRSFWNQAVPADAPIDPDSARMVDALTAEVRAEVQARNGPWIDVSEDGVPIVTVAANQPTVPVTLDRANTTNPAISAAWRAVPLPADAHPSAQEHDLAVWQPSTNRMWEFFELTRSSGRWLARWGGAMQNVSSNPGVYGSNAWPGAQSFWGVTATSLPLVGGAMTIQQMQAGNIDHALALAIPNTRAGVFAAPAERTDGQSTSPSAIPEGARLRLDPHLDLAALHLPPLTLTIARAAQRYGIIIRDTGGEVTFYGQDPPPGSDAYVKLYGGLYPYQLLAAFPWNKLEVVSMDLRHVK